MAAVCAAACLAVEAGAQPSAPAGAPLVAAASDLQFALEEVARALQRDTGAAVRLTFGSSGNLARQIEQGAPFELFFSADEQFVLRLARGGHTRDEGTVYGIGRIALFAPSGSPLDPETGLEGLRALLSAGKVGRFAIANPEHAPYGRAAEQALRAAGLWDALQPRLLLGENISQAAQFVASGNATAGIIAYSLALAPPVRDRGRYALLPETLHEPLRQRMVLTRRATAAAERFYELVRSAAGREILARYGFVLPDA